MKSPFFKIKLSAGILQAPFFDQRAPAGLPVGPHRAILDRMRPRILLVNPPIHDFTAYDFWLKPYGLLRVAGHLRDRADLQLFDYLDRQHPAMGADPRADRWGRGSFRAEPLPTPAVLAYGRWVLLGGDNHRLHEEIIVAGGRIREGRFARMNVGETAAAAAAVLNDEPPEEMKQRLAALWPSLRRPLLRSLEVRMESRTRELERTLERRAEQEIGDMTAILQELERSIRAEFEEPPPLQLELWTPPEREQLERNRQSLRDRVDRIPQEIQRETEAIRARYAHPTSRLFPVAVTFLVPERFASGPSS